MRRKKYIYTNKKHPQTAIMSTVLGTISLVSMTIVIYMTYLKNGQTQGGYGLTGLLSALFSIIGFVLGAKSLQIKDSFKLFPVLGTVINVIVLLGLAFILYLGTG